jgi:hypothetical protein
MAGSAGGRTEKLMADVNLRYRLPAVFTELALSI